MAQGDKCSIPYRGTMTVLASQSETTVSITPTAHLPGEGLPECKQAAYTFQLGHFRFSTLRQTVKERLTGSLVTR